MGEKPKETAELHSAFSRAAFEQVKGLYIDRSNPDWQSEWKKAVNIPPAEFIDTWGKGLPGEPRLSIDMTGGGHGEWNYRSHLQGKTLLSAEGEFSRLHGSLRLKEIRIENESERRHGMGKRFFENLLDACNKWGISKIELSGGREDGAYFWLRRGGFLQDHSIRLFKDDVLQNLAALKDRLPEETVRKISAIVGDSGPDVGVRIARLEEKVGDQPLSLLLVKNTEPRLVFNLKNDAQMEWINRGLRAGKPASPLRPARDAAQAAL